MGIYAVKISRSDTIIIGCGTDIQAKINRHKTELRFGSHRNSQLQEAWNSLGENAVEFEVLDVLEHKEDSKSNTAQELQVLEEMWIHKLEQAGHTIVSLY